ncbi:MAG: hypothetical protein ACKOD2_19470, partial [Ilumatobacteraceae bacterium]
DTSGTTVLLAAPVVGGALGVDEGIGVPESPFAEPPDVSRGSEAVTSSFVDWSMTTLASGAMEVGAEESLDPHDTTNKRPSITRGRPNPVTSAT